MPKQVLLNDKARKSIKRGLDLLAATVRVTLGPMGRNVSIDKGFGSPINTKDGVTVAKECIFEDPFMNHGARIIKEASSKTNDMVGDGSTSVTVLTHAIVEQGLARISSGHNPVLLKKGIDYAVDLITKELDALAVEVKDEDIAKVAAISANDTEIGNIIADVILKVGRGNPITIENSTSVGLESDIVPGMRWQNGYFLPYFVTSEKMTTELDNPYILVTDHKFNFEGEIAVVAEKIARSGDVRPLVVIADEFDGSAVQFMVHNQLKGVFKFLPVKAPYFGNIRTEILKDIAASCGAKFLSSSAGIKFDSIELSDLGSAKKVISTSDSTTIVNGNGSDEEVQKRIESAKAIESDNGFPKQEREIAKERIGRLSNGIGVIRVGAATESELQEIKYRIEDALNAATVAVKGGIVPGGGVALIRAVQAIDSKSIPENLRDGVSLVFDAIKKPLYYIASNAGKTPEIVIETVEAGSGSFGYNAATDTFGDIVADGVVDPVDVTKSALRTACSVGGLFLITEAVIVDVPENSRIDIPEKLLDM